MASRNKAKDDWYLFPDATGRRPGGGSTYVAGDRDAYDAAVRGAYADRKTPDSFLGNQNEVNASDASDYRDYLEWAARNPYPSGGNPGTDVGGDYSAPRQTEEDYWAEHPWGNPQYTMDLSDLPAGTSTGFSYGKAPSYIDPYKKQIDALTDQILNRGPFSYDYASDPSYQQYANAYTDAGRRAMQDTLGQLAARTGGLASSYAGNASQQAYNNYMARLADKVPELRQAAYDMYLNEGNTMRQNLAMLEGLSGTDYSRFADDRAQWNADRDYDTGLWRYGVEDARAAAEDALNRAAIGASLGDYSGYQALGFDTSAKTAPRYYGGGGGGTSKAAPSEEDAEALSEYLGIDTDEFLKLWKTGDETLMNSPKVQEYLRGYLGVNSGESGSTAPNLIANPTVKNQHGESWVHVPGYGRLSWQELERLVDNGEIAEQPSEDGTAVSYRKVR